MSNNEAKFLLNAYRPNGADAADPSFATALAQAKADPQLGTWFAREQAHAGMIAAKLQTIMPPSGLRESILAGGRVTTAAKRPRRSWRWLAVAAGIAALAGGGALLWPRPSLDQRLTAFALDDVVHGRHGGHGQAETALESTLSASTTRLSSDLPVNFQALAQTGCRTLNVAGHEILEICFVRNGAEFHCYIAPAAEFKSSQAGAQFIQDGALAAATWTTGAFRYVVAGKAGIEDIKRLL